MEIRNDKFVAARKASGMTLEIAAKHTDMSKQGYINREKHPDQFRLCEIAGLFKAMDSTSKSILRDAVDEIFLP